MTMRSIKTIVIVGGGTAGWITAGLLGARRDASGTPIFKVIVIEPTDIAAIGVGEGTWPSMRLTLSQIGVSERDFLKQTRASFKQGTKFVNWVHGQNEYYYHPFDLPQVDGDLAAVEAWQASKDDLPFAQFVGVQEALCEAHCCPKQLTSRDFAGPMNYGYHFEADGMSRFLKQHCQDQLSVQLIADTMTGLKVNEQGDLTAIATRESGDIAGDFFIDCTGFRGLLLKGFFGAKTNSLDHIFLADRALTARVPYHEEAAIESTTLSVAQEAGWIWDVSLAQRFGVGYVHSSAHASEEQASETISQYLRGKGYDPAEITFRTLKFKAHYVDKCWIKNCVAIGLSSGFVEPLEASSIMLTEVAARELTDRLSRPELDLQSEAERFNRKFRKRWEEVTHFLKLHYVLSQRDEPFWRAHKEAETIPVDLRKDMARWGGNGVLPEPQLSPFPPESYQFVLYGMKHRQTANGAAPSHASDLAASPNAGRLAKLQSVLPTNAQWLSQL